MPSIKALSKAEAEQLMFELEMAMSTLDITWETIQDLIQITLHTQAWITLGYPDFPTMFDAYNLSKFKLSKAIRRQAIELIENIQPLGLSARRYSQMFGVSKSTAATDLKALESRPSKDSLTLVSNIGHPVDDETVDAEIIDEPKSIRHCDTCKCFNE